MRAQANAGDQRLRAGMFIPNSDICFRRCSDSCVGFSTNDRQPERRRHPGKG